MHQRLRITLLAGMSLIISSVLMQPASAGAVQTGRYVSVSDRPTPAQQNPLPAMATFHFPPHVKTVGQAVHQVLANTGYQLVPVAKQSQAVQQTLAAPLPEVNRVLGPMRISTTLKVLMGLSVYQLVVDPLHRLINFELQPAMARTLGQGQLSSHSLARTRVVPQPQATTIHQPNQESEHE